MSAFSENVRGAQALVGYIYPLIFIPSMALIYLDVNSLPLAVKAVFYAIPYSHPILASKAVVTGDYWNSCVWDCLRCHLYGRHNVYCFAVVCDGEDFDGEVQVGQGQNKTKRINTDFNMLMALENANTTTSLVKRLPLSPIRYCNEFLFNS